MTEAAPPADWNAAIAELLAALAEIQSDMLTVLTEKRAHMVAGDAAALGALGPREDDLASRLQDWTARRADLLRHAQRDGLPAANIRSLAAAVEPQGPAGLQAEVVEAERGLRLLRHESLTNFVLAQRAWLHLSQLVEIIATGGRPKPTYGKEDSVHGRGALVDRVA